jgi:hypothetical protein
VKHADDTFPTAEEADLSAEVALASKVPLRVSEMRIVQHRDCNQTPGKNKKCPSRYAMPRVRWMGSLGCNLRVAALEKTGEILAPTSDRTYIVVNAVQFMLSGGRARECTQRRDFLMISNCVQCREEAESAFIIVASWHYVDPYMP